MRLTTASAASAARQTIKTNGKKELNLNVHSMPWTEAENQQSAACKTWHRTTQKGCKFAVGLGAQRKSEGLRAFAQSLSTARLGFWINCLRTNKINEFDWVAEFLYQRLFKIWKTITRNF